MTDRGSTIQIQPQPTKTAVHHLDNYTAITRIWANGDHKRCRLCTRCDAEPEGVCTVLVDRHVRVENASLYSSVGFGDDTDPALTPRLGLV